MRWPFAGGNIILGLIMIICNTGPTQAYYHPSEKSSAKTMWTAGHLMIKMRNDILRILLSAPTDPGLPSW